MSSTGFLVENAIAEFLTTFEIPFIQEKEIKKTYGNDMNGIDFAVRYRDEHVFIQSKWSRSTQQQYAQFLNCCNKLTSMRGTPYCNSKYSLIWFSALKPSSNVISDGVRDKTCFIYPERERDLFGALYHLYNYFSDSIQCEDYYLKISNIVQIFEVQKQTPTPQKQRSSSPQNQTPTTPQKQTPTTPQKQSSFLAGPSSEPKIATPKTTKVVLIKEIIKVNPQIKGLSKLKKSELETLLCELTK